MADAETVESDFFFFFFGLLIYCPMCKSEKPECSFFNIFLADDDVDLVYAAHCSSTL